MFYLTNLFIVLELGTYVNIEWIELITCLCVAAEIRPQHKLQVVKK